MAKVTWYMPKTDEELLSEAKLKQRKVINEKRSAAIEEGFTFDFGGTIEVVQSRAEDRENIQGIVTLAQLHKSQGTDATITFRTQSDNEYELTPDQAIALGITAMEHKQSMYRHSWDLKSQVEAIAITTTLEDAIVQVEAIVW